MPLVADHSLWTPAFCLKWDFEGQIFFCEHFGCPPPPFSTIPQMFQLNHSHIIDSRWYQQLAASLTTRLKRESMNGFLYCLVIIPGDRNVGFNLVVLLFPFFLIPKKGWYVINIWVLNSRRRVSNKLNLLKKKQKSKFLVTSLKCVGKHRYAPTNFQLK